MNRYRNQSGQTMVLTVVFVTALLGMGALVLDVGSWFRAQRATQATADAAALAAAQALPNTSAAAALAVEYGRKNGGGVSAGSITVAGNKTPNDTISVKASREASGFFARVFGIDSVTVSAKASAEARTLSYVKGISPIAVSSRHPMLNCSGGPCFNQATELSYHHPGSAPKDPLTSVYLNLLTSNQSSINESLIAKWIREGFSVESTSGWYLAYGSPTYLSAEVKAALEGKFGDVIIVPVIKTFLKQRYEISGFAAFKITGLGRITEHHWRIYGSFVPTTAEGIEGTTLPDYGIHRISLVE